MHHKQHPARRRRQSFAITLLWVSAASPCLGQGGADSGNPTNTGTAPQQTIARPVLSDADRSAARALADEAFDALDARQHERAEQLFTQALERADVPTLRVGRADARLLLNRWVEAEQDYQAAVAFPLLATDPLPFGESQVAARRHLEQLKKRMPHLVLRSDDAQATFTIDGGASQSVNGRTEVSINPGQHRVQVAAWGRTETHDVEVLEGKPVEIEAAKPNPPADAAAADSAATADTVPTQDSKTSLVSPHTDHAQFHQEGNLSKRVVITGAVTGALAIGAAVTAVIFWKGYADSRDRSLPLAEQNEGYDSAVDMRWLCSGLTAAAVVGAGLTTYFWLSPAPDDQQAAATQPPNLVGALPLTRGIVVGTGGRF